MRTQHKIRAVAVSFGVAIAACTAIAGCGGGSGGSSSGLAPSRQTRAKIQTIHSMNVRSLSQNGSLNSAVSARLSNGSSLNGGGVTGIGAAGGAGGVAGGATGGIATGNSSTPLIGAFLNNVAAGQRNAAHETLRVTTSMTFSAYGWT